MTEDVDDRKITALDSSCTLGSAAKSTKSMELPKTKRVQQRALAWNDNPAYIISGSKRFILEWLWLARLNYIWPINNKNASFFSKTIVQLGKSFRGRATICVLPDPLHLCMCKPMINTVKEGKKVGCDVMIGCSGMAGNSCLTCACARVVFK